MKLPFVKNKEPSQEELIRDERNFQREQGVAMGAIPANNDDERIHLELQQERADLIRWQQNLDPELQKFIHDVKGEIEIEDGIWGIPKGFKAAANDLFIRRAITLARPLLSKNLIMSNYTEDRILLNLKRVLRTLRTDILHNRVEFEIEKENCEFVVGSFKEMVEAAYFRSLNNGERRHLSTIGKHIEMHNDSPTPPKKSIFGIGG